LGNETSTLHVSLDESGDFTFSARGSKYFVFAVAWTYDPEPLAKALNGLRFSLNKLGHGLEAFHATEDKQANRDAVVRHLAADANWKFAAAVIEKSKVNPSIRDELRFYPKFASTVLKFVLRGCVEVGTSRVIVYTDRLPVQKKKRAVEKAIKTTCREECGSSMPFEVYHHHRASNCWIQVVDYCSWAVFKKWERGDSRTYDQIRSRIQAPELPVFAAGDQTHYY